MRPTRTAILGQGGNPAAGPFWHIAVNGREAVDRLRADAIGQNVDQTGQIRCLGRKRAGLARGQGLGNGCGERHDLDAEARRDGGDLVAKQSGQAGRIALRHGKAHADGLQLAVDAVADQVQPAGAKTLRFQLRAKRRYQLGDEIYLLLSLPEDPQRYPVAGRVGWITPPNAPGGRTQGVGVRFPTDEKTRLLKLRIEELLGTSIQSAKPTQTV